MKFGRPLHEPESEFTYGKSAAVDVPGGGQLQIKYLESTQGLRFSILPQTLPPDVFLLQGNEMISLELARKPVEWTEGHTLLIGERHFILHEDAWGHPALFIDRATVTDQERENNKTTLRKVIALWQAALQGEDQLKEAAELLDLGESYQTVERALRQLEDHPEVVTVRDQIWELDLWEVAVQARQAHRREGGEQPTQRAHDLLKNRIRVVHKVDAALAEKLHALLDKVLTMTPFTPEETDLMNGLGLARIATRELPRNVNSEMVPSFLNRPYTTAAVLENLLLREHVGWNAYEQHQVMFGATVSKLKAAGYPVPEWFNGFKGNEHMWSWRIDGIAGNDMGNMFIPVSQTAEQTTRVLTHERVHTLQNQAFELGYKDWMFTSKTESERADLIEHYVEPATEALSLLILHQGDIQQALEKNIESRILYRTGVEKLLQILQEIESVTQQPLSGTALLVQDFDRRSQGLTQRCTGEVERIYDALPGKHPGAFKEIMKSYTEEDLGDSFEDISPEDDAQIGFESIVASGSHRVRALLDGIPDPQTQEKNKLYARYSRYLQRLREDL